jgi:hypothetical protein
VSTSAVSLDRFLAPLADCLSPDVAAKVVNFRADDATQARIDYLADRANEGMLTDEEREEYDVSLHAIDVVTVLQAKALSQLRKQS